MIIREQPKKYKFIIISAMIVLLGFLLTWWFLSQTPTPNQDKKAINTPETKVEPEVKLIKFPGGQTVKPVDGDYKADDHIWRLVNKSNPLNDLHYRPSNLQLATVPSRADKSTDERSVRRDIMPAIEKLFASAKQAGFNLEIGSGFRGYDLQNSYYTNYVNTYGQKSADTFSAKPGYSEHQTGLVIDVATTDRYCYLQACFGETPAGQWLAKNAHQYGFILRYPKNKSNVTDFEHEPWHFRYVGEELAKALFEADLTLDEATPYLLEVTQ